MMKPVHDINLTKYAKDYLKTMSQARLSILILSKADRRRVYNIPLTRHAKVCESSEVSFAEKPQRVDL